MTAKRFTFHDVHVAGILTLGGVEEKAGSKKYRAFRIDRPGHDSVWYFVGDRDGLRWHTSSSSSKSWSVSFTVRTFIHNRGCKRLIEDNPLVHAILPSLPLHCHAA
jgi:hypothetical protein